MLTFPSAFWSPFWRILLIEMEYIVSLSCSLWKSYQTTGLIKMRSRLGTQFMAFFRLIARMLTFRDKK